MKALVVKRWNELHGPADAHGGRRADRGGENGMGCKLFTIRVAP